MTAFLVSDSLLSSLKLVGIVLLAYILILWLSAVVWTYRDIRTRSEDPISQSFATHLDGLRLLRRRTSARPRTGPAIARVRKPCPAPVSTSGRGQRPGADGERPASGRYDSAACTSGAKKSVTQNAQPSATKRTK